MELVLSAVEQCAEILHRGSRNKSHVLAKMTQGLI